MVAQTKPRFITPEEYLERERTAPTKSEYDNGVIVAMAGASPDHNMIVFDLTVKLGAQLHAGCQGFPADQRVRVPACNKYYYPDLTVVCGQPTYEEVKGMRSLRNPTLIVEVLSESTERKDRGEKLRCYRMLTSLRTYVLVDQSLPRVEAYTRMEDGGWRFIEAEGLDADLALTAIGCTIKLSEIYARITFPVPEEQLQADDLISY